MKSFLPLVAIVLVGTTVFAAGSVTESPTVDDLAWMAGHWQGTADDAVIEEVWLAPAGGQMIGVNRTLADGEAVAFELLRIETDDEGIVYLASPGGRCPATPFRLELVDGARAVFSNPGHDFPQRIEYRREGPTLHARIGGSDNGEHTSLEWSWTLATTSAR